MALPPHLLLSTTPAELEFVALSLHTVHIRPLFSMGRVRLLSGSYGPFRPTGTTEVPLWVAKHWKVRGRCGIVPPAWLNVEWLEQRVKEELAEPTAFASLPFRFAEIAKVLLDVASDDIVSPDRVRALLKDLREVRQAKTRAGLALLDETELRMTNLGSLEITELRPALIRAQGVLRALAVQGQPPDLTMVAASAASANGDLGVGEDMGMDDTW